MHEGGAGAKARPVSAANPKSKERIGPAQKLVWHAADKIPLSALLHQPQYAPVIERTCIETDSSALSINNSNISNGYVCYNTTLAIHVHAVRDQTPIL
jgi:hypothetical protein